MLALTMGVGYIYARIVAVSKFQQFPFFFLRIFVLSKSRLAIIYPELTVIFYNTDT